MAFCCSDCSSAHHQTSPFTPTVPANKLPVRVHRLYEIHRHPVLSLTLKDWQQQLNASQKRLDRKRVTYNSSHGDLYQIFGLYFVFQGVILTAVAQTNALTCHNWKPVFALSLIASFAAICAALQKLSDIAQYKDQFDIEKALTSALQRSIEDLKECGEEFDIEKQQPKLGDHYTKGELTGLTSLTRVKSDLWSFVEVHVLGYRGAVMLVLYAFSGVILFCIHQILCNPGCIRVTTCSSSNR